MKDKGSLAATQRERNLGKSTKLSNNSGQRLFNRLLSNTERAKRALKFCSNQYTLILSLSKCILSRSIHSQYCFFSLLETRFTPDTRFSRSHRGESVCEFSFMYLQVSNPLTFQRVFRLEKRKCSRARENVREKGSNCRKTIHSAFTRENAFAHTLLIRHFYSKIKTIALPQPSYSHDLVPRVFFPFFEN